MFPLEDKPKTYQLAIHLHNLRMYMGEEVADMHLLWCADTGGGSYIMQNLVQYFGANFIKDYLMDLREAHYVAS